MTKILRLEILHLNLKPNLQISASNFTYLDLYLENVKSVTDDQTRSLASFAAASSDAKILRLEILHLNLKSNF